MRKSHPAAKNAGRVAYPLTLSAQVQNMVLQQEAVSARKMDQSLAHSLAWRAGTNWFGQILSWSSFLIVVRLLTPVDFGIVAMATVLWAYLRYVAEFGIPQTVVTLRDLTEEQIAQLNSVALLLALGCFCVAATLARPLAAFFRTPKLALVVVTICAGLLPLGCRAVSEGLLSKEMRFRTLSLLDAISAIAASIATLLLAYLGYGYWALVWGNLAGQTLRSLLVVVACPHPYSKPQMNLLREPLKFGWHVMVSVEASTGYERLDNVTAGRVLGPTALGYYGMAWNLANVPLERLTTLVTTTVPAYFAAVQNDRAALRRYLRMLTEALSLAAFPATIGFALVARDLIPFALGSKWEGVVVPLQVLCIYATLRSVVALLSKLLTAVGEARFVMWDDLAALVILPIGFYVGSHWGTQGIAAGWVVAYPMVAAPLYWKTFKTIEMPVWDYWKALRPAVHGTVVMILAVSLLRWAVLRGQILWVRLVLEIVAGAAVYMLTLLLLHRGRMQTFFGAVKGFRSGQV